MPSLDNFVGYDSESKGFHIYWPNEWSVTVKWDVIFNQENILTKSDHVVILSDVLSEGEKEKVIQHSKNTTKTDVEQPNQQIKQNSEPQTLEFPKSSHNFIPFPPSEESQQEVPDSLEIDLVIKPNMGCGHWPHHVLELSSHMDK